MKKLLLGLGAASLTILPIAAMVSCSSDPIQTHLTKKEFNVSQPKSTTTKEATTENVIDPEFNVSAKQIVAGLFNSLTVEGLQRDFNLILTDFFDIYEFEQGDTEIELVDNGITVKSIGAVDNDGFRTATLSVKYKIETDSRDTEKIETKDNVTWKIKPMVSSYAQIQQIKKLILSATTTNPGIDIKDLKEYFLGEKDDDQDFDDIGVFDRIAKLNKENNLNNLGGLVGYEVKLSDIFNQLKPASKTVTLDTVFFAPSAALNNTFLVPSQTGSLDYQFDEVELKKVDEATVIAYKTKENLATILVKNAKNTEAIKLVKDIAVEKVGPLLKLTINFVDTNKPSEVISINPVLLKPTPVVTPPPVVDPALTKSTL